MIKRFPLSYLGTPIILFAWFSAIAETIAFQTRQQPSSSSLGAPQIRQYTSAALNFGFDTRVGLSKPLPVAILTQRNMAISDSEPSSPKSQQNEGIFRAVFNAVGSTTSIVVSGTYFVVLAYQRDALMVSFFIGSISNAVLGKVL